MLASSIEYGEAFRVRRFNLSGHRIYVVIANWEPVEFVQSVRHSIAYEAGLHRLAILSYDRHPEDSSLDVASGVVHCNEDIDEVN